LSDNATCECGFPVEQSLEGSLETLLKGYIICKGCGRRIEIRGDAPRKLNKAIDDLKKMIRDLNRKLR